MKFINHFLYNLKKNNILFISSLIIIILFSLYINYNFKEGMESENSKETWEAIQNKIIKEQEKLLTDEEKGNDEKISVGDFLSGKEGNIKKGVYKQIIAYKNQQRDLGTGPAGGIEDIKKSFDEEKNMTAIQINNFLLSLTDQISHSNFINKLSKIIGISPSMMNKASVPKTGIKNPFS